jgi:hypothetical protein
MARCAQGRRRSRDGVGPVSPDHSTTWISAGIEHRIDTWCPQGHTPERCLADHNAAVAAAQAIFPPS